METKTRVYTRIGTEDAKAVSMVVLVSIWVAGSVLGVLSLALVAASSRPQPQMEEVPSFDCGEAKQAAPMPALRVARVNA